MTTGFDKMRELQSREDKNLLQLKTGEDQRAWNENRGAVRWCSEQSAGLKSGTLIFLNLNLTSDMFYLCDPGQVT